MDIDLCFIVRLLQDGTEGFQVAREKRVKKELFEGPAIEAWQIIVAHEIKHGKTPSLDTLGQKLGIEFENVPDVSDSTLPELIETLTDRYLYKRLVRLLDDAKAKRDDYKPHEIREVLVQGLRALDEEGVAVDDSVVDMMDLIPEFIERYQQVKAGKLGIPTPWGALDEVTLGWQPEDVAVFVARLGVGKCIDADTLMMDPVSGHLRRAEDFYKNSRLLMRWSREDGIAPYRPDAYVDTGYKDCLKISFDWGGDLTATPEHPLLTSGGDRRIDELVEGDYVACAARMPFPMNFVRVPDHIVDLLALMTAEGSATGNHVGFSNMDSVIVGVGRRAGLRVGCLMTSRGNDHDFVNRTGGVNPVWELVRHVGLACLAKEKRIPGCVFQFGQDQLRRFISLLWSCDGSVERSGSLTYASASKELIFGVRHLLLRLGIVSRVRTKIAKCNGKEFVAFELRVRSECYDAFKIELTLVGEKLAKLNAHLGTRNPNDNIVPVTQSLENDLRWVVEEGREQGILLKHVGERLGWKTPFMWKSLVSLKGRISIRRLKAFCEVYGVTDRFAWLWRDIFWSRTTS